MKCGSELKSESLIMCSKTKGWSVFVNCWREPRKEKYKFVMLDQMKLEFFKKSFFFPPTKMKGLNYETQNVRRLFYQLLYK
jgi:hypothetical protein